MTDPLAALQALVAGGQSAPPAPPQGGSSDIMAQLAQLAQGSGGDMPSPGGSMPPVMSQAISSILPSSGLSGPDPRAMSLGVSGTSGPGTDNDYYNMHVANQGVRGNLPPQPKRDYSDYGSEMEPMDDPRQTPMPLTQGDRVGPPGSMGPGDQRDYPGREYPDRGPGNGPPGQQLMGDYLKTQKGSRDSTQSELDDVSDRMGGGDVIDRKRDANTDEPTPEDIRILKKYTTDGNIANFNAKYGKGSAAYILSDGETNDDLDEDDDDTPQ